MTTAPYSPEIWNAAEVQPPEQREATLLAQLPAFIAHAQNHSRAYGSKFAGLNAADVTTREALAHLPITRKSDLIGEQHADPPFGGYDSFMQEAPGGMPSRLFVSPGPIAECEFATANADYWRTAAALYATGFRAGMLLHNSFSYHFTPAGFMCDEGARALGGCVFPAGAGNSEQQARAAAQLGPQCYSGTPDFLLTILQRAEEAGLSIPSLSMGCVSGGYLSPDLRDAYAERGMRVLQWYGSADVGCIAYETEIGAPMVLSENLLLEVVDPLTQQPCGVGEKGEVLITNFNPYYPLLRFSLGDYSAIVDGLSACGRTNMRIAGWLGRCDAAVKVRGMFVHPAQMERLLQNCSFISHVQLVVRGHPGQDKAILRCVLQDGVAALPATAEHILTQLTEETKLRGEVEFVDASAIGDSLIVDERKHH